ncbi:ABC transporter-like protein [Alicyclobacillus hesperidum URH17-3-68]|uniref:ATP-binding cassette domain-containing protein n=1 Tax=Alicyclobacillus hesperidum TaxID=89784 RepID=UPI000281BC1E|nr:ATP-binding cassette domain-containing protein [Alicyclobacillus hesperidum]EJY55336.1 ABC transporter-like protein [Alicyclobacillus hesperidum URH17-3-68]
MSRPLPIHGESPLVSVRDLAVTYDGEAKPSVRGCTFSIHPGECMLLAGPSGSGKSTLAMALAGIIPQSVEGVVTGECWIAPSVSKPGKIGYVFQDPESQFCMHHVDDEIAFGLENLQIPRDEMAQRTKQALAAVHLHVHPHAPHARFSGGMKQKLAIACALAMESELFIFDEPTANLDPTSTRMVFAMIAELRKQGKTLLIIEHKYEALLPVVDRVIALNNAGEQVGVFAADEWRRLSQGESGTCLHPNPLPVFPTSSPDPVLALCDLALTYGGEQVWQGIDAQVGRGEWIAIVGPNGAGKSSLLETMAGLRRPSKGIVKFAGRAITGMSARERYSHIAYGFQNPEYQFLYEQVADEMASRVLGDDIPEDVLHALGEFGLAEHAHASPYALSQGQKRRLSVAVMMRTHADIWLFDEPTYGQDPASEAQILNRLLQLQADGKSIVTVTHDMNLVQTYATRVWVLAEGTLLYDGAVSELLERQDILERAHLFDDIVPLSDDGPDPSAGIAPEDVTTALQHAPKQPSWPRRSPVGKWHPDVKALTLLITAVVCMCCWSFGEAGRLWALVLVLAFAFGWCHPGKMVKRLLPLVLVYVIYLWAFAANAATPPGYRYVHWLWFHISWYGLNQGLLVVMRTFATVILAYVLLVTTDGTDFMVGLSQSFRIVPKMSYGMMAGMGFLGRFGHDLETFRMARRLRGREGWWILRPVTYALPLLSQSVRISERLAIAMEARGFYGDPANAWNGRTYYRQVSLRARDMVAGALTIATALVLWLT